MNPPLTDVEIRNIRLLFNEFEHLMPYSFIDYNVQNLYKRFSEIKNPYMLLHIACRYGYTHIVREIINAGINLNVKFVGCPPIVYAIRGRHIDIVIKLLHAGVITENSYYPNHKGLLHYAVDWQLPEMVRILLHFNVEVNSTDVWGNSVLHYTFNNNPLKLPRAVVLEPINTIEIFNILIHAGANVNVTNDEGRSVLYYAIFSSNELIISTLLNKGASASTLDFDAMTFATINYSEILLKKLLDNGASANLRNDKNETILHKAAGSGRALHLPILIRHGVSMESISDDGLSPLAYAFLLICQKCEYYTLEYQTHRNIKGLDSRIYDIDKFFIQFHMEEVTAYVKSLSILVKHGANVNNTDKTKSPLYIIITNFPYHVFIELVLCCGGIIDFADEIIEKAMRLNPSWHVPYVIIRYAVRNTYLTRYNKILNYDPNTLHQLYFRYHNCCLVEIKLMYLTTIFHDIPISRLFAGNLLTLNKKNRKKLHNQNENSLMHKFPIYFVLITFLINKEKVRQSFLPHAAKALENLLGLDVNYRTLDEIMLRMSVNDLGCLISI